MTLSCMCVCVCVCVCLSVCICVCVLCVCVCNNHICDMTHPCVTWLIHMCDMAHSWVWHDSFMCVTWLIHMCDMTDSYVWRASFICVTCLIHMCDMTHSYVSLKEATWYARYKWKRHVPPRNVRHLCHFSQGTHMHESCHIREWVMSIFKHVRHDSYMTYKCKDIRVTLATCACIFMSHMRILALL